MQRRAAGRRPRDEALDALLARTLAEDRADEDLTTRATVPAGTRARGVVTAQGTGVVSGVSAAARLARQRSLRVRRAIADGARVRPGRVVLELEGSARELLTVERPLLNLLMHLSGVATGAAAAVRRGRGRIEVRGTRKTIPGMRALEKEALRHGGAAPHRSDLASGILLKNNHLALVGLEEAVHRLRALPRPRPPIEVEVRTEAEALRALRAGAEELLLDNVPPRKARRIVAAIRRAPGGRRLPVELSGGLTAANLSRYLRTGADSASLGSLTHSSAALPFHLTVRPLRARPSR